MESHGGLGGLRPHTQTGRARRAGARLWQPETNPNPNPNPNPSPSPSPSPSPNQVALATGKLQGMQAFMAGKMKVKGNMMLAQKFGALAGPGAKSKL